MSLIHNYLSGIVSAFSGVLISHQSKVLLVPLVFHALWEQRTGLPFWRVI